MENLEKLNNKNKMFYILNKILTIALSNQSSLQKPIYYLLFYLLDPDPHPPFRCRSRRSPVMQIQIRYTSKIYSYSATSATDIQELCLV